MNKQTGTQLSHHLRALIALAKTRMEAMDQSNPLQGPSDNRKNSVSSQVSTESQYDTLSISTRHNK